MANPVEKERSVMDRVRAGELTLADIVPVKLAVAETSKVSASYREAIQTPERPAGFGKETIEMEAPQERAAARREGRRAAREEERPAARDEKPEMEEAPAREEKPAKRNLASVPVKSDEFDIAFEEEGAPVRKSGGKKKKGGEEDFLF